MRKTHLDLTDLTLFGVTGDYLGLFKSLDFDWEAVSVDGTAVSQRYGIEVVAKKRMAFTVDELITATALRQTGLNVTVFSIGGTSYLGQLRSGTLKVTTSTKEGSGVADPWEFPYAVGTKFELQGELQVASASTFVDLIAAAGTSQLQVAVSISLGGSVFTAPMLLTASSHKISVEDIQTESITLKNRGVITAATGNPVLASIGVGTSVIAYSATTGANVCSGNALIAETTISFSDGAIIGGNHKFLNQGTPTNA